MSEHEGRSPQDKPPEPQHELSNIRLGALVWTVLLGFVFLGICLLGVTGLFWGFEAVYQRQFAPAPKTLVEIQPQYPEPYILAGPEEYTQLTEQNQRLLREYAWISHSPPRIRIPIEQAMKIIAEEGLPQFHSPSGP